MTTILGIGGSLRKDSVTRRVLEKALEGAERAGAQTQCIDLATFPLPMFNGTYELDGYTPAEQESIEFLLDATRNAQGLILATPTYHNTLSGSLKNALDYMELLGQETPPRLEGKVVGLISVQLGSSGTGNNAITSMLLAARAMRAWVAPTMIAVLSSRSVFNEDDQVHDPALIQRLQGLGIEVTKASRMFAENWLAE